MNKCICIKELRINRGACLDCFFVGDKYRYRNIAGLIFCQIYYGSGKTDYIIFTFSREVSYYYFYDYFVELHEYRENKIDKILN